MNLKNNRALTEFAKVWGTRRRLDAVQAVQEGACCLQRRRAYEARRRLQVQ